MGKVHSSYGTHSTYITYSWGYRLAELVFVVLEDSKSTAMHAAEIGVLTLSLGH